MGGSRVNSHIQEVQTALDGERTARDRIITESWRRCVLEHGLDPTELKEAYIVRTTSLWSIRSA